MYTLYWMLIKKKFNIQIWLKTKFNIYVYKYMFIINNIVLN